MILEIHEQRKVGITAWNMVRLIREKTSKKYTPQAKINSPPLSTAEIRDVEQARKSKGKLFNTPEELIEDLHKNVADSKKKSV